MDELSRLPESVRKLALDRFRLLQPHLEQNRPLRPVAIEAGIPYRTAQRWVTRFQRFGLAALVRKKRTDAGVRRTMPINIKAAIEVDGRIVGRRPKLTPQQQAEIIRTISRGDKTAADAARLFSVHPATISRLLARAHISGDIRPNPRREFYRSASRR
jgi:hypothetical protein